MRRKVRRRETKVVRRSLERRNGERGCEEEEDFDRESGDRSGA